MKEYISVGKNVDIAIKDGLTFLGLSREDVDIKILETGGLFKKAKVCLQYEEKVFEPETTKPEIKIEESVQSSEDISESKTEVEQVEEMPESIEEITVVEQPKIEKEQPIKATVNVEELKSRISNFLIELASKLNLQVEVSCEENGNDLNFKVTGNNLGKLIGYRGETLTAIQNLLSTLKKSGEGKYRLYIDIGNYKKDREQTLVDLANRMADKAEEIERNVHLDPMSAYERRIIHSTLQNRELVETESMGEGEKRHVVIKFKR